MSCSIMAYFIPVELFYAQSTRKLLILFRETLSSNELSALAKLNN